MAKKGFTLEEISIALVMVGILSVLMINAIQKAMPDKNKIMFKKAYSITERTVAELVNDETLYPYNSSSIGFLNTVSITTPSGLTASGNTKMCTLFVSKVNTIGNPGTTGTTCSFETTDGITWSFPNNATFPRTITVYVGENGKQAITSGSKQNLCNRSKRNRTPEIPQCN